jgi:hypothetical protein
MNRAIRIAVLIVGMVGTFLVAYVQPVPSADGGPILTCPEHTPKCGYMPPPLS